MSAPITIRLKLVVHMIIPSLLYWNVLFYVIWDWCMNKGGNYKLFHLSYFPVAGVHYRWPWLGWFTFTVSNTHQTPNSYSLPQNRQDNYWANALCLSKLEICEKLEGDISWMRQMQCNLVYILKIVKLNKLTFLLCCVFVR